MTDAEKLDTPKPARKKAAARQAGARARGEPKPRRRMPMTYFENAALYYLGRFASSSANLRRVLLRKVARQAEEGTEAEATGMVDELIARYLKSGLLDDQAYASQKAGSLARRGTSRYSIAGKLAQKGVTAALVKNTLQVMEDEGSSDVIAACALTRRRRLGPYRSEEARPLWLKKDMATMARAGFGFDIVKRILTLPDVAAVEALARGEDIED